jgi:hypothetical protein
VRVELRESERGRERWVETVFLRPTVRELRELCARHGLKPVSFRFEGRGLLVVAGEAGVG